MRCLLGLLAFVVLPAPTARPISELRFAIQGEPRTLDPLLVQDEPSYLVSWLTQGRLVRLNRLTHVVEPELATSWKASDRGRRITFNLRPAVRFSDGSPFRAAAVCATIARLNTFSAQSPITETFRTEHGAATCKIDSELTASVMFADPVPSAERLFDDLAIQPVGPRAPSLGPFVIAEQRAGAYLLLARNQNYWKRDKTGAPLPYIDSVRIEIQRNRDAELIRFRRGEYHLVNNLDPEMFERLRAEMPSAVQDAGGSLDIEQFWFNLAPGAPLPEHKKAWFREVEFRRAVSQALRREDLARVVFRGHATPACGPVSKANRLWHNSSLACSPPDPKAALARLSRLGFRLAGNVLRDRADNPVEFSIVTNSGNKTRERMAAMVQQDLAAVGMKINIVPLDFPSLIERMTRSLQYEACLLGLTFTDPDPSAVLGVWLSSSPGHAWNPNQKQPATPWEAEIDRLMLQQSSELDPRKRKAAFDRVQQIVTEQVPFVFLLNRNALLAASPGIRNLRPAVLRPQALWNVEQLSLTPLERASNEGLK